MQKTLPLNSPTSKALSCIDPYIPSHSVGTEQFKSLSTEYLGHLLSVPERAEASILLTTVSQSLVILISCSGGLLN